MDVLKAIETRRAYRSLKETEIDDGLVKDLARSASLSASCFNKQPWRFVFVRKSEKLDSIFGALPETNRWIRKASMIVAVASEKSLDCVVGSREYFLFDTGMATASMILRATELGLVAHPIAGFSDEEVKKILGIPEEMTLITLVVFGKKDEMINELLTEKQRDIERQRPERLPFEGYAFLDEYGNSL